MYPMNKAFLTVLTLFLLPFSAGILFQGGCKLASKHQVGEEFVAKLKPYSTCDEEWCDWQLRWEDVYIDNTCLKFRDIATLQSFFKHFFLQRTVRTGEVDFWDIPLLDSVVRAGRVLGLKKEDFSHEKDVRVYFVPSGQELVLVHIKFRPIYIEALFKKQPDSWYSLVDTIKSTHVRYWEPSFYFLRGATGKYLLIPDWYGATGSGLHEEKLMVFDISMDKLTGIVEEVIFKMAALYSWSYLASAIEWNPHKEQITVTEETVRGQLGKKQGHRRVLEVIFNLKKKGQRVEKLIIEEVIVTTGTHKDYSSKSPDYEITVSGETRLLK